MHLYSASKPTRNQSKLTSKSKGVTLEQAANTSRFAKAEFADGSVYVDLKLTESDLAEGLARDLVRRMQQMRKEMDLKVDSYVEGYMVVSPKNFKLLQSRRNYMAHEVRARKLTLTTGRELQNDYYSKVWEIDGEKYELGLRELDKTKKTAKQI